MTIRECAFEGKPVPCFVVDAHTHMGPSYHGGWYQTPEETRLTAVMALMERLGIDCIVNASHFIVTGGMAAANEEAAVAVAEFPGKVYGYISICPSCGIDAVRSELEKYKTHPQFLGLKLLGGYHGPYTQPEFIYAFDFANEMSCPVLLHTWCNDPPLTEIAGICESRRRMQILCAHQGGGDASLTKELASIMKDVPNITMEICGSLSNTLSIEEMTELTGEDRIVYGSDMVDLDPRYDFGRVVMSTLPDEVKCKILSGNYLRLLENSSMGRIIKNKHNGGNLYE